MFDHVFLNVSNIKTSTKFYTTTLKTLGIELLRDDGTHATYGPKGEYLFGLYNAGKEASTKNMHLAFSAPSRTLVDEFYRTAIVVGGKSNGEPGVRKYDPRYYAAYVLDPDGNNIEAVTFDK